MSFWNGQLGLLIQVLMLLFTLAIAGVVMWSLFDGTPPRARPRMGEAEGIALLLPVGAAYLLYRSLKRRRAVLRSQRDQGQPAGRAAVDNLSGKSIE